MSQKSDMNIKVAGKRRRALVTHAAACRLQELYIKYINKRSVPLDYAYTKTSYTY
jgi:hypothetical protein